MARMSEGLIAELKQEAETTRRQLSHVPDDQLSWQPHEKSLTLGQLALHIATTPGSVADLISNLEVEPVAFGYPQPESMAEVMTALDQSVDNAAARLNGWDDQALMAEWRMATNGKTLLAAPRIGMVRAIMLNHWYHHRGQLQVYLRLLGRHVPSVYGPTADENPFQ